MQDYSVSVSEGAAVDSSPYVEFGERYLRFREDTPYPVWSEVVRRLKNAEKSIQWWLGDALKFGERKYGEMYAQALEETDYAYGSLANMAYVAGRVDVSRRREDLSFAHHQAVAPLSPEEQEERLAEAAPEPGSKMPKKSARQLQNETRRTRKVIECAKCGEVYPLEEARIRTEPT